MSDDLKTNALTETETQDVITDLADLLFNRACYQSLFADEQKDPRRYEELKAAAENDVFEMVKLNPKTLQNAVKDPDFRTLLNVERPKMAALLEKFKLAPVVETKTPKKPKKPSAKIPAKTPKDE